MSRGLESTGISGILLLSHPSAVSKRMCLLEDERWSMKQAELPISHLRLPSSPKGQAILRFRVRLARSVEPCSGRPGQPQARLAGSQIKHMLCVQHSDVCSLDPASPSAYKTQNGLTFQPIQYPVSCVFIWVFPGCWLPCVPGAMGDLESQSLLLGLRNIRRKSHNHLRFKP